jgi:LacI family transcriptional regulator
MPDHNAIGALAADHLIERGHRRIAVLNPYPTNAMYRQRCDAFIATAQAAGVQIDLLQGAADAGQSDEIVRLTDQWLAQPADARAAAFFVPADEVVFPLYRYLRRQGIKLAHSDAAPGNGVELVSSDNDRDLIAHMHPRPQTVDLNRETIAELAVERLFWRMRNGVSAPQVTLMVRPMLVPAPSQLDEMDGF